MGFSLTRRESHEGTYYEQITEVLIRARAARPQFALARTSSRREQFAEELLFSK
jgi:hypothetical protein